jgi:hypothetical protein
LNFSSSALIIPGLGEEIYCYTSTIAFLRSKGYDSHFVSLIDVKKESYAKKGNPWADIAAGISLNALESNLKFGFCLSFSIGASIALQLDGDVFEKNAAQLLIDPIMKADSDRLATIKAANLEIRRICKSGYPLPWKSWGEGDRKAKSQSLRLWKSKDIEEILHCERGIAIDFQGFLGNKRNFLVIPSASNLSGVDWSKEAPTPNVLRLKGGHEIQREDPNSIYRTIENVLKTRFS